MRPFDKMTAFAPVAMLAVFGTPAFAVETSDASAQPEMQAPPSGATDSSTDTPLSPLARPVPATPVTLPNATPGDGAATQEILFTADQVQYDDKSDVVTASGNVELNRDAWHVRADTVTWHRTTGRVQATGSVIMTGPDGDTAYGDSVELSDTLRDGVIDNLLVVMENGNRIAAAHGERDQAGNMTLLRAAYSPCAVEDSNGCPKDPSWQVRAARVYYDRARNRIRYEGARLELFGLPIVPLPFLSHPAGSTPGSGVLRPNFRIDRTNGLEFALPYYLRLSERMDLTLTPHVFTNAAPMAEGLLRRLTATGAWQVQGYATYSRRVSVSGTDLGEGHAFRGYIDTVGAFQFDPHWSISFSGRLASDRTFLRRYDISDDDRLRSTFTVARNGGSSYLTISGWAVQTLRTNDNQGGQVIALPAIDFRQRMDDPLLGGRVLLQANTLALTRTEGQDTQRLFASARWDLRRLAPFGAIVQLTALARGDVYHTADTVSTLVDAYRGAPGWQSRAFAAGAAEISYPLIAALGSGTQRLTPRVQFVASTPVDNVDIPNEDSRAFELQDSNIFEINRFPGYDRVEDTTRVTYGFDWAYERRGLAVSTSLAQSYRIGDQPLLFQPGTGLNSRLSDIVGRTTIALGDVIRATHRFRLDKDNFAIRRNEIDFIVGSRKTYVMAGYLRLNRDISTVDEDLPDREEVRVGGRVQIARYWSLFGSAIVDLTDRNEDPQSASDGFTPIRHRLGVTYEDDCVTIGLTWRRDYQDRGDARSGNSFMLRLAFRNLGV